MFACQSGTANMSSVLNLGPPVGLHPESTSTSTFRIPFARNYGLTNLAGDKDLGYQPSTGTLSANFFEGQFSGTVPNATNAVNSEKIDITSDTNLANKFLTFVDTINDDPQDLKAVSTIKVIPQTGVLVCPSATFSSSITVPTVDVTNILNVANESTFGDAITVSVDGGNKIFLSAPGTNVSSGDSNYMRVFNANGAQFVAGCDGVGLINNNSTQGAIGMINNAPINFLVNGVIRGFFHATTSAYSLVVLGAIYTYGIVYGTFFQNTSDDRLKHNEQPITGALDTLKKLRPQIYDKTDEEKDIDFNGVLEDGTYTKEAGFIAQEILQDAPELDFMVTQPKPPKEEDSNYYFLNYTNLHAYEVSAIQELSQMVESLKEELKQIKDSLA
tara:strand:- start:188 stop:1348 length:1161 start_codon:yes stop_codon:yes gene_type:complete